MSTRERILEAAVRVFADAGYAGATTRQLAAAAEVNVATLNYHFGGKEKLYNACIRRQFDRLLEVEAPIELLPKDAPLAVELVVRLVYRYSRGSKHQVRLMLRHFVEHGHLPDEAREGWNQELLARGETMWKALDMPMDPRWKLKVLCLNHLITRFAITEPPDLEAFVPGDDPHADIEEILVEIAKFLLVPG